MLLVVLTLVGCFILSRSSLGVDIFGSIGIPKNRKFYALSFISIVKIRIVKQKL